MKNKIVYLHYFIKPYSVLIKRLPFEILFVDRTKILSYNFTRVCFAIMTANFTCLLTFFTCLINWSLKTIIERIVPTKPSRGL